jgi:hypothetical protein
MKKMKKSPQTMKKMKISTLHARPRGLKASHAAHRTHRISWRNSSRYSSCPLAHVSLCVILSDQEPIIMCQCHETLLVMWCCRLLPWRRGSSKVHVYTLSIIMRLTGAIFAFLQCLKLVCFMFHQAVVAATLITLIFWSSSSAAAAPVGPKTGHAWNSNC